MKFICTTTSRNAEYENETRLKLNNFIRPKEAHEDKNMITSKTNIHFEKWAGNVPNFHNELDDHFSKSKIIAAIILAQKRR